MKQIFIILTFFICSRCQAQQVFITAADFDKLPDTTIVFLAALWCAPCVEKQNYFEATVKAYPKLNYVAIYDTRYYNEKRHVKMLKHSPPGPYYFWGEAYYVPFQKTKFISEINPLKRLVPDLEALGYRVINKEKIWYGQAMVKRHKEIYIYTYKDQPRQYVPKVLKDFDIHTSFPKEKSRKKKS